MGLWDRPTRRPDDRPRQQLDQSLGSAVDMGDERLRARRHFSVLHLNQAHLGLRDQGGPPAAPVLAQVGAPAERVRAGDGQAHAERWSGVWERPGHTARARTVGRGRGRAAWHHVPPGRQRRRA